ncbi:MAG: SGNH/GDSL hydrolase family protein [Flavobacteriaceae bacterium]
MKPLKIPLTSILLAISFLFAFLLSGQNRSNFDWHEVPSDNTQFEGQGWKNIGFNRLPDKAEKTVRDAVWSLSRNSAGLGMRFTTDSDSLIVEYQVDGNLDMRHMPATGASGLDLYVKGDMDWLWLRGKFQFSDTISYVFSMNGLAKGEHELHLLFPLYNNIKNVRIGAKKGSSFKLLPVRVENPIVVYGTSIAQGACASRPGMAWTNILARKLDLPVINLGFSGNGRLEPEVIDLINEISGSVFVLDCLPNLSPNTTHTEEEVKKRIRESVESIQDKHPRSPILLVQHAGYSDGLVDGSRKAVYETLNNWMIEVYADLKTTRRNVHMLSKKELDLSNDAFVDGTHPTDLGMLHYALAYERKLREIMKKI